MFLPLHLVTPDFRAYFPTPPKTGRWGLIPLSLGTVPCTRKSDIQRDNLLGNPVFHAPFCIDKDPYNIIQRKKMSKPVKEIFVYYV